MDSPFKRYRGAFSHDPDSMDPHRILSTAMQPQQDSPFMRRPTQTNDPGFQERSPGFGIDPGFQIPNTPDITPRLDAAMELGAQRDQYRQPAQDSRGQGFSSSLQGFAQGLAATMGSSEPMNFGQALARGFGVSLSGTTGAMDKHRERARVEEDRQREIEDQFFNRSLKLQDLAVRRRAAEAELESDRLDRGLRSRQIDVSEHRAEVGESRLDELERHNRETEAIGRTNAGSTRVRSNTYAKTGGSRGTRAKTPADIDKYAMEKTVAQFGSTPENIQAMLSTRNKKVTAAYNRYRSEATKSNVDERLIEDTPEE